jgi:type II secretory pathway component GspD/PulD (secretin)
VDWKYTPSVGDTKITAGTNFGAQAGLGSTGLSLSITGERLSLFLRALQSQGRGQILQRPQIIAADNKQSKINIGKRVPFITDSRTTETGTTLNTIQYQDVGVTLTVTPRINPDGLVRMDVDQKIDDINPSTVDVGSNVKAIIVDSRSATTTVTVQDGHTIVIGGIITSKDVTTESRVPFLGDLPLIGNAFKSTHLEKSRSELLIILTPHVVRNTPNVDEITKRQLDRMNQYRELMTRWRPGGEVMNLIDAGSPLRSGDTEWKRLVPTKIDATTQPVPLESLPGLERRTTVPVTRPETQIIDLRGGPPSPPRK